MSFNINLVNGSLPAGWTTSGSPTVDGEGLHLTTGNWIKSPAGELGSGMDIDVTIKAKQIGTGAGSFYIALFNENADNINLVVAPKMGSYEKVTAYKGAGDATVANVSNVVIATQNWDKAQSDFTVRVTYTDSTKTLAYTITNIDGTEYTGSGVIASPPTVNSGNLALKAFEGTYIKEIVNNAVAPSVSNMTDVIKNVTGFKLTAGMLVLNNLFGGTLFNANAPLPYAANTLALDATGSGTRYDLGVGQAYEDPADIPWSTLTAGDVVNVYYREEPYAIKCRISGQGTATDKIIINGVTDAQGRAPHFTGVDAKTANDLIAENWDVFQTYVEVNGLFILSRSSSQPYGTKPKHITFQNLRITDAHEDNKFTAADNTTEKTFSSGAAGIYSPTGGAEDILIQNCEIVGCGNGVFCNTDGATDGTNPPAIDLASRRWTIRSNSIYKNGTNGSDRHHNMYIQCEDPIIEFNFIGGLTEGALGSAIKDRSSGTVIRYNIVLSGARILDVIDTEGGIGYFASDLDKYDNCHIYGNILVSDHLNSTLASSNCIHWGGDTGVTDVGLGRSIARMGTMHFYNNTVLLRANTDNAYRMRIFDMSEDMCRVEAVNNIVKVVGNTHPMWMNLKGNIEFLGTNIVDSQVAIVQDREFFDTGGTNTTTNMSGADTITNADPLLTDILNDNFYARDYTPGVGSPAIGAASALPADVQSVYPVDKRYVAHYQSEARTGNNVGAI